MASNHFKLLNQIKNNGLVWDTSFYVINLGKSGSDGNCLNASLNQIISFLDMAHFMKNLLNVASAQNE